MKLPFGVAPANYDGETDLLLQRLMSVYCHAVDNGDADLWADCYTEDGEYHAIRPDGSDNVIRGWAALRAYCAAHDAPPVRYPRHMCWAPVVEVDGDKATMIANFSILNDYGAGPILDVYGEYENHFVRGADEVWRLQQCFARVQSMSSEFIRSREEKH